MTDQQIEVLERLRTAGQEREDAELAHRDKLRALERLVAEASSVGLSYRQISEASKISHQRVGQLLNKVV